MLAKIKTPELSRRGFLTAAGGAGVGLAVGLSLPGFAPKAARAATDGSFNPFVLIAPDGSVTVLAKHLDKGQGILTGLTTLVAEELDADWAQMRADFAPADTEKYKNLFFGVQGTGGSTAIANSWQQYRKAGAMARAMLVEAAAKQWGVAASEITVEKGVVAHASGKQAGFGDLAEAAAGIAAPADVALKDPAQFTLIGNPDLRRIDGVSKTDGSAIYTQDIVRPGMLYAAVAHPPRFGATVASFDAAAAKAVDGVADVVQIPRGIAVLAKDTWTAFKGREALAVEWDESKAETRSTDAIFAEYRPMLDKAGTPARSDGDAEAALANAAQVVEADFEFPFLAHAAMEPMNAVVEAAPGTSVEIWTGSQLQTVDQAVAAQIAGVEPGKVTINTLLAGGSFGRRAVPNSDYVAEAVQIAVAIGGRAPVKLVWSREDDMAAGFYRPVYVHRVRAGLDADGKVVAWQHRIVGQSIVANTPFAGLIENGIDNTSVEGASNMPYKIPNIGVDLHTMDLGVPVLWWRAVGSTHTAYAVETMIDQLAKAAGKDPVEFRLDLLSEHPRHAGVLKLAAEKAGWGGPLPDGVHRGVAVHESFNSYVAQVAEVRVRDDGSMKVERVVCAIDCGVAVNPDQIKAQMEGGIGYGLGAAMRNEVTLTGGEVDQRNFDTYEPLRIDDMPKVEAYIVPSAEAPTGVGEPGTPVVAPAVANAVFDATGNLIKALPFARHGLV